MLTNAQIKKIKSLHTKKGRDKTGLCLVEGQKLINEAAEFIELTFSKDDTDNFDELVTTETPQDIAAIARIPEWTLQDVEEAKTILVLDGIQDPGNIGTILRLCLGFSASLILVESADPTNPKVIRSSAGAIFKAPWVNIGRIEAEDYIKGSKRSIYRLEKREDSTNIDTIKLEPKIVIVGSEGSGIKLKSNGNSVVISHSVKLESLNVANATAILLYSLYKK